MDVYIAKDQTQLGPFSEERVHEMVARGDVSPEDLAWMEGAPDWKPLKTVLNLAVPPPLPPREIPDFQAVRVSTGTSRRNPVVRDVLIIMALTALGGLVVGTSMSTHLLDESHSLVVIAISNLVLGTVGFTIAGCSVPSARWRHLSRVALWVWLVSFVNVVLLGVGFAQWISGAFFTAFIMGIGGTLSYIFKGAGRL